jgi:hypothetical protein
MRPPNAGVISIRLWFGALIAVSAALLVITTLSYAAEQPSLARVLFWLGLGGEANIGAWWSGMLLALAAFLAFDGFFDRSKPPAAQRGWLALGLALLLLSFDEIASLHEYLSGLGLTYLAMLGVVGLTLASYGMQQLHRARVPGRTLSLLLLAFGLLASVALQERIQHSLQWDDQLVYGLRASVEEGTEIVAMLIFICVARATSTSLLRGSQDCLVALVRSRRLLVLTALLLWPMLVAATFALPRPGGPPAWLASTLFLACALLAARAGVLRGELDARSLALILFYLAASAAANAVPFRWVVGVLGVPVNLRGAVFALLVVVAVGVLRANGRRLKMPRALLVAAVTAASAIVWPTSQILWCGLPPAFALWLYAIESKAGAEDRAARAIERPLVAQATPTT